MYWNTTSQWFGWLSCIGLFALALFAGCGQGLSPDYQQLGLVEVSGTVTLDGQPLANVTVKFEESPFLFSYGVTDQRGRYRLMFDSRKSGIIPGEKTVRFVPGSPKSEQGSAREEDSEGDPDAKTRNVNLPSLPVAYIENSNIRVTVVESDGSFDFDLLSDGSTTGRK